MYVNIPISRGIYLNQLDPKFQCKLALTVTVARCCTVPAASLSAPLQCPVSVQQLQSICRLRSVHLFSPLALRTSSIIMQNVPHRQYAPKAAWITERLTVLVVCMVDRYKVRWGQDKKKRPTWIERKKLGSKLIRWVVSGSREQSNQRQKALKAEEVGVVNETPKSCSPIRWRNMREVGMLTCGTYLWFTALGKIKCYSTFAAYWQQTERLR